MTRKEHLEFCKKCLNRKFDSQQGLICDKTGKIADFEVTCENFNLDESIKEEVSENLIISNEIIINELDDNTINKLKIYQDFYYAVVGGLLSSLISAFVWAVVTVLTKFQIGYMAIGVGLLVGFSVRFFGAGIDKKFGYLGAFLSLLGCLLGNLFSQVGFIAQEESLGYFETLTYLNFGLIFNILIESFSPMDLLFYGIAVFEGYKLAFRRVSVLEIKNLQSGTFEGYPSNYKLRMPLVIVSIVIIGFFFLKISQGVNGVKTFKYESGNKMSEGEMKHSKEHGKWTYWHENGKTQLICFYSKGLPDSLWQWFDEFESPTRIGNYKNGFEHGIWMNYYNNGNVSDSGGYFEGRMDGEWKYKFENGNLYQIGYFKRNLQDSIWKTYYENGKLNSKGEMNEGNPSGTWSNYYDNGQLASNIVYISINATNIEEAWDREGNQIVENGNGFYKSFSNSGQLILKGKVENGLKVGEWVTYFENGKVEEEGNYENEIYRITNSWDITGKQNIKDGNGFYKSYYADGEWEFETGKIENGLREGVWKMYYQSTHTVFQEFNYSKGKMNGLQKIYFESSQLYSSGEMIDNYKEGEWSWYFENGNISSTASFSNDKKEGKQIIWSEVGEKTKEEIYKDGVLIDEKFF
jgi:antitoxin component YwqK of YwqJK toxin-antitoxin module